MTPEHENGNGNGRKVNGHSDTLPDETRTDQKQERAELTQRMFQVERRLDYLEAKVTTIQRRRETR